MAEIVGAAFGTGVALSARLLDFNSVLNQNIPSSNALADFRATVKKHGIFITILLYHLPEASFVMDQVERYVVHASDPQVLAFLKSYNSSFNMVGVAGAIMAQVAISAMSLTRLEDAHWTAHAFLVLGLTTGALSVFFSCAISPAFHGLHSAEDIKYFLTKPAPSTQEQAFRTRFSDIISGFGANSRDVGTDDIKMLRKHVEDRRWKIASPYAAIMLVAPMILLRMALNTFLIGLGIYLGEVYTSNLIPSYGSGSIGILVFYICSGVFGLAIFYIPQGIKQLEDLPLNRWRRILDDYNLHDQAGVGQNTQADAETGFRRQCAPLVPEERNGTYLNASRAPVAQSGSLNEPEPELPGANQSRSSPMHENGDVAVALKSLIQSQEESLQATRLLLEIHQVSRQ